MIIVFCLQSFIEGNIFKRYSPLVIIKSFVFKNCIVTSNALGTLEYTKDWKFFNTSIDVSAKKVLPKVATAHEKLAELNDRQQN